MHGFDVIVIGTGGVGSAALECLARRGLKALGLDRFPIAHDRGSSHGATRVIRKAYFEHPDYVPLLHAAYDGWFQLEQSTGQELLHQVGLVEIGPEDGVVVPGVLDSAQRYDLQVESLSAEEANKAFPQFHCPESMVAVVEKEAGYLLVEECVETNTCEALRMGAEHQVGQTVLDWSSSGGEVIVTTDKNQYSASGLIVAAGAWSNDVLASLGLELRVVRKHLHWYSGAQSRLQRRNGCPTFLFELPNGIFYGFPEIDEFGVKVGEHSGGTETRDPLGDPREIEPDDVGRVDAFVEEHLVGLPRSRVRHSVCFYTMSPDDHFVVDKHPLYDNVVFAAGLSGHGFKFTNVLGQALVDLVVDGSTELPVSFLRLDRPGLK